MNNKDAIDNKVTELVAYGWSSYQQKRPDLFAKELKSSIEALIREARIEELKLPTPKIKEIRKHADDNAHLFKSKEDAFEQGARFVRNRVQKAKIERLEALKKDSDG